MNDDNKKSIYPNASKGDLSDSHDSYLHPPQAQGPKMGDTQSKLTIVGIVFFVIFLLVFAFMFGFGKYFSSLPSLTDWPL